MKITDISDIESIINIAHSTMFHKHGNILYSGKSQDSDYFVQNIDELRYRNPKNTPLELHDTINNVAYDKFGVLIRNGLFATTKIKEATEYGTVYRIFPTEDNYTVFTNPNVSDLTFEINKQRSGEVEQFMDNYVDGVIETKKTIYPVEYMVFGKVLFIRNDLYNSISC